MTRIRIVGIEKVKASDLVPHPQNWRVHPERQRETLRAAVDEIGFTAAPIVRKLRGGKYQIIDGHLRAEEMGDQEIPVIVTDLTEAEAKKALLTTDPLTAMAGIGEEALLELLGEVAFDADELTSLAADLQGGSPRGGLTDADAVPAPPAKPKSKRGDLYTLGDHRLLCGDATDADDVARLLDGDQPPLTITDPPYGVDYDPAWRERYDGRWRYRTGKVAGDDRADWRQAIAHFPGPVAYLWHASQGVVAAAESLESQGFALRAYIIWVKQTSVFGRGHYHWAHEPCWYAVRKGDQAGWIGGRKQSTIWEIANVHRTQGTTDDAVTEHGTQKPVECMERPLRNHTGDVYDPFLGSGTTLIAAERLGRRCYGMEIEPGYADVVVKRWQDYTGQKAERQR